MTNLRITLSETDGNSNILNNWGVELNMDLPSEWRDYKRWAITELESLYRAAVNTHMNTPEGAKAEARRLFLSNIEVLGFEQRPYISTLVSDTDMAAIERVKTTAAHPCEAEVQAAITLIWSNITFTDTVDDMNPLFVLDEYARCINEQPKSRSIPEAHCREAIIDRLQKLQSFAEGLNLKSPAAAAEMLAELKSCISDIMEDDPESVPVERPSMALR